MRQYKTAMLTVILSFAATCAIAQVTFNPAGGNASLLSYTFEDVSDPTNPFSGNGTVTNHFSAPNGEGSFTVEGRGYADYVSTTAQAETNDFGTYLATLINVNLNANTKSRWGVNSSGYQTDSQNSRLTDDEAMIFTFVTTNLGAETTLSLDYITWGVGGAAKPVDVYIYDSVSNVVVDAAFGVGTGGDTTISMEMKNGYQLVIGNVDTNNEHALKSMTLDISAPTPDFLSPPIIMDVTTNNTFVSLDWVDDANQALLKQYDVYRSTVTNEVSFSNVLASVINSAYTDTNVVNGTTYYYMAKAVDTNDTPTAFGSMASATPFIQIPDGLSANSANEQVALTWNTSTDRLFASFNIYRSTVSGSFDTNSPLANVTATTYTDTGVNNDATYYYAVSTVDSNGGKSGLSTEAIGEPMSGVYFNFCGSGGGLTVTGEQRIVLSDLGSDPVTFTHEPSGGSVNWNGVNKSEQDYFSTSTAFGQIVIKTLAYNDTSPDGAWTNDFLPETWSGDDLTGTFGGTTGGHNVGSRGTGVNDGSGHASSIGPGEAFLFQFDLSGLSEGVHLVLKDVEIVPNKETKEMLLHQRNYDVDIGTLGAGVQVGDKESFYSDIVLKSNDTFAVTGEGWIVSLVLDVIGSYEMWAGGWDVDIGSGTNDYDFDGLANLAEYALGGNPTNGSTAGATLPTFTPSGNSFLYVIPKRSDDESLVYTVETTDDLVGGTWTNNGYLVTGTNVTGGTLNFITNEVGTVESQKYIRLKITQ